MGNLVLRSAFFRFDAASLHADQCELQALLASSDLKALEVHVLVQMAGQRTELRGFTELEQAVRDFDFARGALPCTGLLANCEQPCFQPVSQRVPNKNGP